MRRAATTDSQACVVHTPRMAGLAVRSGMKSKMRGKQLA
jgi:hypothetical protein